MTANEEGKKRRRFGDLTLRFRTGSGRRTDSGPQPWATEAIEPPPTTRSLMPVRYQIKEDSKGRFLSCVESSNIVVRIERGFSTSGSAARKYPTGTIFLDGAAQGEPFMDSARGVYNLDHHEGCVRAFTLATCEQAVVVIRKGLDLDGDRWLVYANEPDLDTVLAIWLLLNHRRVAENDSPVRRKLMPVIRLQGVIDAHGLELVDLTGFPDEVQRAAHDTINELRAEELQLKRDGQWGEIDLLDFTVASLQKIDELVYTPLDFEGMREIEELARTWISSGRFAIACRSEGGVYEIEEHLKQVHGDRIGLLVLQKDSTTYTLRQIDPFLPTTLEPVYERLNLFDPTVTGDRRWGGSQDIGGSPRGVGTGLDVSRIMAIIKWVLDPPTVGKRLATVGGSVGGAAVAIACAVWAANGSLSWPRVPGLLLGGGTFGYAIASCILVGFGLGMTILGHTFFPGHFGLRLPVGIGFLAVLPLTIVVAVIGGAWAPLLGTETSAGGQDAIWLTAFAVVAGAVGIELLCRGAVHGLMVTAFPVMQRHGRHFVSVPNVVAAGIYCGATMVCLLPPIWPQIGNGAYARSWIWLVWAVSCLVLGLLCGGARERWGSLWAAAAVHTAAALTAWLLLSRVVGL
jgi:hypothetical protein